MAEPTVDVVRRHASLVVRDCPYCHREHHHGVVGPAFGAGDGHRVAHCAITDHQGYVLREVAEPQ